MSTYEKKSNGNKNQAEILHSIWERSILAISMQAYVEVCK